MNEINCLKKVITFSGEEMENYENDLKRIPSEEIAQQVNLFDIAKLEF